MTWAANPVAGHCSFGWWRMLESKGVKRRKGWVVRKRLTTEPVRRRAAVGRVEVRRLRAGILVLGASLGFNAQAVVRFSEAISGKRWRRCGGYDLEQVVSELARIGGRRRRDEEAQLRAR